MYAYVKLINSGKFTTVGTNQIKNYKPNRPSKVFEVKIKGEYHKCLIGLTNESKEGLTDQINKGGRVRFPPAALLSDLSEIDEKTCPKEKKSVVEDNTRDILNKKLSAINKVLFIILND
ncbi:Protein of unknown function [Cotesia congregata]|uniref:Uncharacterized protein n=1 Tax=Cotesia congregata TaxID=51543 RepID=A0A8J2EHY5_COTCN|nr:Protein of unknown function [Cotesia congregata]